MVFGIDYGGRPLALTGQDPVAILDPSQQCAWVGVGNIAKWFFYTAPAALRGLLSRLPPCGG
jgi:hypothetical protein